ncbi:MAG: hypothetical protein CL946_03300 [Ectothiorhodospiraceae bacterium]|nr:hypothetical protein [Ectothiorhodospiraceae bacterium]
MRTVVLALPLLLLVACSNSTLLFNKNDVPIVGDKNLERPHERIGRFNVTAQAESWAFTGNDSDEPIFRAKLGDVLREMGGDALTEVQIKDVSGLDETLLSLISLNLYTTRTYAAEGDVIRWTGETGAETLESSGSADYSDGIQLVFPDLGGWRLRLRYETKFEMENADPFDSGYSLEAVPSYFFGNGLSVGAGVGYQGFTMDAQSQADFRLLPVFARAEYHIQGPHYQPYVFTHLGYAWDNRAASGTYLSGGFGVYFRAFRAFVWAPSVSYTQMFYSGADSPLDFGAMNLGLTIVW